ncbi:MAG: MarR family transcriptional regulator [Pseudomonadota bacterium]
MEATRLIGNRREQQSVRLWLELLRCAKLQEQRLGSRMKKAFGHSLTRFDVLSQLYRSEGSTLPVTALADKLLASASRNITGLVDRMVDDGLVERRANPDDRRSFTISLTDRGRAVFEEMAREHARWVAGGFEGLSQGELKSLQSTMISLREHLEQGGEA